MGENDLVPHQGSKLRLTPEEWAVTESAESLRKIDENYQRLSRLFWGVIGLLVIVFVIAVGLSIVVQRQNREPLEELLEAQRQNESPAAVANRAKSAEEIIQRVNCLMRRTIQEANPEQLIAPGEGCVVISPPSNITAEPVARLEHDNNTNTPDEVPSGKFSSGVRMEWEAPPDTGVDVTGYRVARDGVDISGYGVFTTDIPADQYFYEFYNLIPGATYNVTVAAITDVGIGQAANRTIVAE